MQTLTCSECGKKFQYKNRYPKTCSDECKRARDNRLLRERRGNVETLRKCEYCGKEFYSNYSFQVYCSHECGIRKWNTSCKGTDKYSYECSTCGKTFSTSSYGKKYCCNECRKGKIGRPRIVNIKTNFRELLKSAYNKRKE